MVPPLEMPQSYLCALTWVPGPEHEGEPVHPSGLSRLVLRYRELWHCRCSPKTMPWEVG